MQTFGDRIQIIMDDYHVNLSTFASTIGIAPSSASTLRSGKTNASPQTIKAICDHYGVCRQWLIDGTLPKYSLDPASAQIADRLGHAIKHKSTATDRLIRAVAAAADNEAAVSAAVDFLQRVIDEYISQLPDDRSQSDGG